jgi:zinc transport system permease protein
VGDALGHALVDGQLYFARAAELAAALLLAALTSLALPWLGPRLLRARIFPRHDRANRLPAWRWHLGFDLLAALGVAVGTATLGLMGAFALVLVPAWIAFRLASGWGWALALGLLLGVGSYLAAFALALGLDQPFGPVLVAVLLVLAGLAALRSYAARADADG